MAEAITYQRVWNKYLPVIVMKMKVAAKNNQQQELVLDRFDFENAGVKKTTTLKFSLELKEGRAMHSHTNTAIARDFALAMNEHEVAKDMLKSGNFNFSFNSKFILTIQKN